MPNSATTKILTSIIMIIIVADVIGDSLLIIRHTLLNFYESSMLVKRILSNNYNNRVSRLCSAYKTC